MISFIRYLKKLLRAFNLKSQRLGQINENSQLGRWIILLSSLNEVKNIVEIGTWNGMGSSRMIRFGVSSSTTPFLKSITGLEIDPNMARSAASHLKGFPNFRVIHGRIVDEVELDSKGLSPMEQDWFEKDLLNFKSCANVFPSIPERIDLLILDGGEFSSFAEFIRLKSRIDKWVVLDDTLIRKNRKVYQSLVQDSNFMLVWNSDERNGCCIFKRI